MAEVRIAGFEILELIGQGGSTEVWKARQTSLDRPVALISIRADSPAAVSALDHVLEDARTCAKLKHSGLVQVYDVIQQERTSVFVIEYVDGMTVTDVVNKGGAFKVPHAMAVAESVAVALDHAWTTARLSTGNVRPSSILLDHEGRVRYSLFQISETQETVDGVSLPVATSRALSLGYAAPERLIPAAQSDARGDMYSLGASLYYMLSGQAPFPAGETRTSEQPFPPLDALAQRVNRGVVTLIGNLTQTDPASRYREWEDVLRDIRAVLQGRDIKTRVQLRRAVKPPRETPAPRLTAARRPDEQDAAPPSSALPAPPIAPSAPAPAAPLAPRPGALTVWLVWILLALLFAWFTILAFRLLEKPRLRPLPGEVTSRGK